MKYRTRFAKILILVLVGAAVLGWTVTALWNWLLPDLLPGVKSIGFLQALGLLLLSRILFGGFHGRHGFRHHHGRFRNVSLSPDEKERLRFHWCRRGADAARSDETPAA